MTDTVEDLVALMDLERLELDLFRGSGFTTGFELMTVGVLQLSVLKTRRS